jgi:hypothetical protein
MGWKNRALISLQTTFFPSEKRQYGDQHAAVRQQTAQWLSGQVQMGASPRKKGSAERASVKGKKNL